LNSLDLDQITNAVTVFDLAQCRFGSPGYAFSMESEINKYLGELRRYRELLRGVSDERACKVLMELITEVEARLRGAERVQREGNRFRSTGGASNFAESIGDKEPTKRAPGK
jgi:hypothetical protein